jgi:hypothetical protein
MAQDRSELVAEFVREGMSPEEAADAADAIISFAPRVGSTIPSAPQQRGGEALPSATADRGLAEQNYLLIRQEALKRKGMTEEEAARGANLDLWRLRIQGGETMTDEEVVRAAQPRRFDMEADVFGEAPFSSAVLEVGAERPADRVGERRLRQVELSKPYNPDDPLDPWRVVHPIWHAGRDVYQAIWDSPMDRGMEAGEEALKTPGPFHEGLKRLADNIAATPFGIGPGIGSYSRRGRAPVIDPETGLEVYEPVSGWEAWEDFYKWPLGSLDDPESPIALMASADPTGLRALMAGQDRTRPLGEVSATARAISEARGLDPAGPRVPGAIATGLSWLDAKAGDYGDRLIQWQREADEERLQVEVEQAAELRARGRPVPPRLTEEALRKRAEQIERSYPSAAVFAAAAGERKLASSKEAWETVEPFIRDAKSMEDAYPYFANLTLAHVPSHVLTEAGRNITAADVLEAAEGFPDSQVSETVRLLRERLGDIPLALLDADDEDPVMRQLLRSARIMDLPVSIQREVITFGSLKEGQRERDEARERGGREASEFAIGAMTALFTTAERRPDGKVYIKERGAGKAMRILSGVQAGWMEAALPIVELAPWVGLAALYGEEYTPTRDYENTTWWGRTMYGLESGQVGLDLDIGDLIIASGGSDEDASFRFWANAGLVADFFIPYEWMAGVPFRVAGRGVRAASLAHNIYGDVSAGGWKATDAARAGAAVFMGSMLGTDIRDPFEALAHAVENNSNQRAVRGTNPLGGMGPNVREDIYTGASMVLGLTRIELDTLLERSSAGDAVRAASHLDNLKMAVRGELPDPTGVRASDSYKRVASEVEKGWGHLRPEHRRSALALLEIHANRTARDGVYDSPEAFFAEFHITFSKEKGPVLPREGERASGAGAPTFFSAAEQLALSMLKKRRSPGGGWVKAEELKNRLRKEPGVKRGELDHLQIEDWLDRKAATGKGLSPVMRSSPSSTSTPSTSR